MTFDFALGGEAVPKEEIKQAFNQFLLDYATLVQHLIISARLTAFAASRANYIGRKYDVLHEGTLTVRNIAPLATNPINE